jgi:hypothetical protein
MEFTAAKFLVRLMTIVLAKKISLIPRWTLRVFSNQEATEKYEARIFHGGIEV